MRLGPDRNTKAGGGKRRGSLGKEAGGGMEAKKKEGVSFLGRCCQKIVVWLSSGLTPRARSQHQWETGKKVGSGGSGPCWLSDKESTQLACESGQERARESTRQYLPPP